MSTQQYDLVVVLGQRFTSHWHLRRDLEQRLNVAVKLYEAGRAQNIIVCGRWTIWFDWLGVRPAITEARLMRAYLIRHHVPAKAIYMEQHSKDTIGNLYYLKLFLSHHRNLHHLLIICADQHAPRVQFLVKKFFGASPFVQLLAVPSTSVHKRIRRHEAAILRAQQLFLAPVRDGHVEDLQHHLYTRRYYRLQAQTVERLIARQHSS